MGLKIYNRCYKHSYDYEIVHSGGDIVERCLLSIDWDYFVYVKDKSWGSYLENDRSLVDLWYKRYIQAKLQGMDIIKLFQLSPELNTFWKNIREHFNFEQNIKVYVSDSHTLSYNIAKDNNCRKVYLFDAHSDLGYGGLSSLNFEVNCSNWLGKLFKDNLIREATIVYSPYTSEKPEYFKQMNNLYKISYCDLNALGKNIKVSTLHICRSGAWTPPWFDKKFAEFVNELGIPYQTVNCPARKWDIQHLSFSDQINYMMA